MAFHGAIRSCEWILLSASDSVIVPGAVWYIIVRSFYTIHGCTIISFGGTMMANTHLFLLHVATVRESTPIRARCPGGP